MNRGYTSTAMPSRICEAATTLPTVKVSKYLLHEPEELTRVSDIVSQYPTLRYARFKSSHSASSRMTQSACSATSRTVVNPAPLAYYAST